MADPRAGISVMIMQEQGSLPTSIAPIHVEKPSRVRDQWIRRGLTPNVGFQHLRPHLFLRTADVPESSGLGPDREERKAVRPLQSVVSSSSTAMRLPCCPPARRLAGVVLK